MSSSSDGLKRAIRNTCHRFSDLWQKSIAINFEDEGRPKWKPAVKKDKNPLLKTGTLNSYMKNAVKVKPRNNKIVASCGTIHYAKAFSFNKKNPRPFLPPQDKDIVMLTRMLQDEIKKNVGGN